MTKMEKTRRGVTPAVETVTKAPRRANTMHLSHAGQATVTTRQYARRAVLYALLFTLGGLFLFLYLIKGEGSVVFLLPTVVVVVFLVFLACGFKMSYASLRPRVNKTTAKKVAALSVAAESAQEALSPVAVPAPPVSVPDKAARALAKLFRHYGGNLQGVPDDILVHYAKDMLSGEPTPAPKSPALAHFAPVLQTISTVFKLLSPPLKTSVDLISFENFQEFSNTYQINLVQLFSDKMKNDFEVPLIESYFRLFPLQSQFFYPHIYAALIRGMGINRTDINFKQKIPFSINILEPFGSLKKDFIEGFEQEFVQKSLEDYCETKIMDLLKANLENKKIKSTDPKTFLSLFNIPLTNQNLTLDYKIGPDLTVDKLLKAYTEVLKNKNNVENLLTEIDPGIFGTKKDAKNIAKRLKILARTLLELKVEFISAYIQASDKLNISLDFSKTGIIDSFFEEITASADQNLVITFTVDMQPQEQDFKKMYDNLSGSNEDQNSSEYYVFKKNSFTDFIKSLGDDNLFSMAIRRMLETFEDYRITEMAAIYFSLVGFLVLAWRASISDKNKLPFYLRQFKVTQEVKKKLGENPSEGSKTGRPGRVGTAYDYSYTIQNEGSATFETEYIEVTGAEGEINRQMLSERLIRFLKTQLNKNDDKISEITVIGVFFSEKNNMEFLRADIGFLKWIKERVNTWKLTK